jgi:hypothetical protein
MFSVPFRASRPVFGIAAFKHEEEKTELTSIGMRDLAGQGLGVGMIKAGFEVSQQIGRCLIEVEGRGPTSHFLAQSLSRNEFVYHA